MGRHARFTTAAHAVAVTLLVAVATPCLPRAAAAGGLVLTVDSEDDEPDAQPGDLRCATARGRCTLRAAVQESNATPGAGHAILPQGFYDLEIGGAGEDAAASGDLDITDDLNIEGAGAPASIVNGRGLDGVFHVLPGAAADLRGLTIGGGLATLPFNAAGGIVNEGTLLLSDVSVIENVAPSSFGTGGLLNLGTASIEHSHFERNTPDAITNDGSLEIFDTQLRLNGPGAGVRSDSGSFTMRASEIVDQAGTGVFCQAGPTLIERSRIHRTRPGFAVLIASGDVTVRDSVIEANEGGGINNDGSLRVERSTLRANSRADLVASPTLTDGTGAGAGVAGGAAETGVTNTSGAFIIDSALLDHRGGGLVNEQGGMTLVNVTVSGNSSTFGAGGITNFSELEVRSSTITDNRSAGEGANAGGLATFEDPSARVRLSNTIIAGNTSSAAAPDCFGPITSEGHNLIGDRGGCDELTAASGDRLDADPALGPLADNGGPTLTHALLDGSAATDAGSPAAVGSGPAACPTTDQRGAGRPHGTACDIGAFEVAIACGDGGLDSGEACDDGNLAAGDCCSPLCRFEALGGDCDASGAVEIGELLRAVAIALGNTGIDECAVADVDGDGRLAIAELVRAVQAALVGCQPAE
jgi:cysteine-rich repeat protein